MKDLDDDLDSILEAATPAFEDVVICLDGSRRAEWNELTLASLQPDDENDPDRRFGAKSAAKIAREKRERLADELGRRLLRIRITALPGTAWAALKAKYPPRDKNTRDLGQGYNIEAVARQALLTHGKRIRLTDDGEPQLQDISAGQWSKIFDKVGGGDLQTLEYGVIGVNQLAGQQFVGQLVKGSPATSSSAGK